MNLSTEDLTYCHKVLSGDIRECRIFIDNSKKAGKTPESYLVERISDDERVIASIEKIIGKVEWKFRE